MEDFIVLLKSFESGVDNFLSTNLFLSLKAIGGAVSIVLIILIIYLLVKTEYFSKKIAKWLFFWLGAEYEKRKLGKRWKKIIHLAKENDLNFRREAIKEANKIVNEAMGMAGFIGKDIYEKLVIADIHDKPENQNLIFSYQTAAAIEANPDFEISQSEALKVLLNFEKKLKELEAI